MLSLFQLGYRTILLSKRGGFFVVVSVTRSCTFRSLSGIAGRTEPWAHSYLIKQLFIATRRVKFSQQKRKSGGGNSLCIACLKLSSCGNNSTATNNNPNYLDWILQNLNNVSWWTFVCYIVAFMYFRCLVLSTAVNSQMIGRCTELHLEPIILSGKFLF